MIEKTRLTDKSMRHRLEFEKRMPYCFAVNKEISTLIKYEKLGKTTGYVVVDANNAICNREVAVAVYQQALHLHRLTEYALVRHHSLHSHDSQMAERIEAELALIQPEEFSYSIRNEAVATLACLQIFVTNQRALDVHLKDILLILDKIKEQQQITSSDWSYLTEKAIAIGDLAYEQIQYLKNTKEQIEAVRKWISRKNKSFTKTEAKYMNRFSTLLSEINAQFIFDKVVDTLPTLEKVTFSGDNLSLNQRLRLFNERYTNALMADITLDEAALALLRN